MRIVTKHVLFGGNPLFRTVRPVAIGAFDTVKATLDATHLVGRIAEQATDSYLE